VALLEYSDYFPVDITNYENVVGATIGTTNYVPLTNVVVGGTTPDTGNNGEVALDIEMAIAMAPKLSRVMVYEKKHGFLLLVEPDCHGQSGQTSEQFLAGGQLEQLNRHKL